MIVLDASAAVDWLLQTPAGQRIEHRIYSHNETLHTPHLLDLEVTQVLRRLVHQRAVPVHRADEAVRDLLDLRITRYAHVVLLARFGNCVTISRPTTRLTLCLPRNSELR
jgi:predicted nucleic acid-binding protein